MKKTLEAANLLKDWIIKATASEKGVHVESVIAAASRMAGTQIFRAVVPVNANEVAVGTPVFTEQANSVGSNFMDLMLVTVQQLGNTINQETLMDIQKSGSVTTSLAHHSLLQTQELIDPFYTALARTQGFSDIDGARAFVIAAAFLINDCKNVLDIHKGCSIAIHGLVEGAKTMPRSLTSNKNQSQQSEKPWYKFWQ